MNLQEFKELIKSANNKASVFTDFTILQNIKFDSNELIKLIKSNLSSEEIFNLLNYEYYKQMSDVNKNELINAIEFPMDSAMLLIQETSDDVKKMLLTNKSFVLKNFSTDMIPVLYSYCNEELKEKIMQLYSDEPKVKIGIYKQYDDEKKTEILNSEQDLNSDEKLELLEDQLEEIRKNAIIECYHWWGFSYSGFGGLIITKNKEMYSYNFYKYVPEELENKNANYIVKNKILTNREYKKVEKFIKTEILNHQFENYSMKDAEYDVTINYNGVEMTILNNSGYGDEILIYDKAHKLMQDILNKKENFIIKFLKKLLNKDFKQIA